VLPEKETHQSALSPPTLKTDTFAIRHQPETARQDMTGVSDYRDLAMNQHTKTLIGLSSPLVNEVRLDNVNRRKTLRRLSEPSATTRPPRNNISPRLALTSRSPTSLRAPKRNVRALDEAHIAEIASSINDFGFCDPILIDGKNIIEGVVRAEAAKRLGLRKIPCIEVGHLNGAELKALRIRLNRTQEQGGWIIPNLALDFGELIEGGVSSDICGFSAAEWDSILQFEKQPEWERRPLSLEEGVGPIAREGDVFILGAHRVACGDSRDPNTFSGLFEHNETARYLLTDPPYNARISALPITKRHREFKMASGEMSDADFLAFNKKWLAAATPYVVDGGHIGSFADWRSFPTVHTAAIGAGLLPVNLIVWFKPNGMGNLYRSRHELFPLFRKGGGKHVNNIDLGKKGRNRTNVWEYPFASSVGTGSRKVAHSHPTRKPCAMIEDAILDLTNRGDIVLDPFLGSGTTLIAAERTGRVCRGIEIDPLYVDLIVRTYARETKKDAVLAATGELFSTLAAQRAGREAKSQLSSRRVFAVT
jgi:DNA modification methylase